MTDPKTADILRTITDAVRPMCIETSPTLNEAGNHVVRFIVPGVGVAFLEMDEARAINLACALVEPFARAKGFDVFEGPDHG